MTPRVGALLISWGWKGHRTNMFAVDQIVWYTKYALWRHKCKYLSENDFDFLIHTFFQKLSAIQKILTKFVKNYFVPIQKFLKIFRTHTNLSKNISYPYTFHSSNTPGIKNELIPIQKNTHHQYVVKIIPKSKYHKKVRE